MKTIIKGASLLGCMLLGMTTMAAEAPVMVYLVNEQEADEVVQDLDPIDLSEPEVSGPNASERLEKARKKLDDLIADQQKGDDRLNRKRQRVATQVEKDQKDFIELLDVFLTTSFDPGDDDLEPGFVETRERIVDLVFNAPTKRDYYELLFLINASWLSNPEQVKRFESLDLALQEKSLELETRQRKIRTIIMGATTVVGIGLGGYLSYRASTKIIPIVANEGGLSSVAKLVGRGTIIVVGAGVGAAAGAYVGFLGSAALFENERSFIDPIDGTEDLREILDYIDDISTKYPI